jgi:hypothetical protein
MSQTQPRRRWSERFKGFTSWKKSPKSGVVTRDLPPIAEAVEIPDNIIDPNEYVLVLDDFTFKKKNTAVCKEFFEKHLENETFELYPVSSTHQPEFKRRFGDCVFEVNKLHKRLPNLGTYHPIDRFAKVLESEKMAEAIYILNDLGAQVILLDKNLHKIIKTKDDLDLTFSTPESVPVAGSQSVNFSTTGKFFYVYLYLLLLFFNYQYNYIDSFRFFVEKTLAKVQTKFTLPEYQPHLKPGRWFYENKKQYPFLQELVPKILQKQSEFEDYELAFAGGEQHEQLFGLQIELSKIIGVGTIAERSELSEFKFKFKVKFFDKEILNVLPDFNRIKSNQLISESRKSLSKLAMMRIANYAERHTYREDFLFPDGTTTPLEEWTQDYSESTWMEWLSSQASSNVFTVPLVLYGPKGTDNALSVFTWDAAIRGSALSYHDDWEFPWNSLKKNPHGQSESFMKNVRFNPYPASEAQQTIPIVDDEMYDEFRQKDRIRLLVRYTHDAKNIHEDVQYEPFPFGLRVLVLNMQDLEWMTLPSATTQNPNQHVLNEHKKLENFLGPIENYDGNDENEREQIHTLNRYPPIAVLVLNCNSNERQSKVKNYMNDYLSLTNVYFMPTFEEPTESNVSLFASNEEHREKFIDSYEPVSIKAINALDSIIQCIVQHEFHSHRVRQAKERKKSVYEKTKDIANKTKNGLSNLLFK